MCGAGHCYLAVEAEVVRRDALDAVATMQHEGVQGYLAEIDTRQEQAFLESILGAGPYWLGGTCQGRSCSGGVQWDSGEPGGYDALCKNLPRGASNLMWDSGCWSVGGTTTNVGYLVEFPLDPMPTATSSLSCDDWLDLQRCFALTCYENGAAAQCLLRAFDHPYNLDGVCVLDPDLAPPDCARWAWHVDTCDRVPDSLGAVPTECDDDDLGGNPDGAGPDRSGCQTAPLGGLWGSLLVGLLLRRRKGRPGVSVNSR